ncbi:MAG: CHAT domain-containing protein [Pyrinomonadaceae bacterium]
MTLSLDPRMNPLIRLYQLFEVPGVETEDNPNYLRVTLPIKWAAGSEAYDLARFLSAAPAGVLRVLRLCFDTKHHLADFTSESVLTWFEWDTIEELIDAGSLCEVCAETFHDLRSRLEAYELGANWPTAADDSLSILNDLENCPTCSPHLTIDASVDKTSSADKVLIGDLLNSEKKISSLVWYDPAHMTEAFVSFQEFLEFMTEKVDEPLVMFFYRPIEPYLGDYFEILPFSRAGVQLPDIEAGLAQELSRYTTDTLTRYKMLRTDHKDEKRTALGERFDIPPTLFLRQSSELASYPSHPVFTSGPLRSLLVYSMMAWLAVQTDEDGGTTIFSLSVDENNPVTASFNFSLTDVRQGEKSIFGNDNWRDVAGRLARDIGRSVGSDYFRDCWAKAINGKTPDDFTADHLFNTLEAIRQNSEKLRRDPPQEIRNLTPDLALHIYVDGLNKRLVFQLGYLNADLGLGFELPDSLAINLEEKNIPLVELNELAKRNLTAILGDDQNNPGVRVPKMEKLETRGQALWDDMIPPELKRAYTRLRQRKDLTLFIFSEDRSFPWELIKPRELQGSKIDSAGFDDDWWALHFGIARWAAGAPPPANEISITRVCCVAASSALSNAQKELAYFESLTAQDVPVDSPKTRAELIEFLNTRNYDVIHFACHGQFNTEDPGESAIQLPDTSLLQPDDLRTGNIPQMIRNNRPLIFLNSCHSGRTGSTLVGIAGWARRLVDWGCGAFIGCGWEVADPLAAEFAITFYQNFRDKKKSLGQAVHQARRQIKEQSINEGRPQNSTWLAYYLYGNPNCRHKE